MHRSFCLSVILGSFLLAGVSHALEPVEPQPATPLTFSDPAYQKVIPSVAKEMIADGVVVIDVRSPMERITEGFIPGSVNVPLPALKVGAKLTAAPDFNQKSIGSLPQRRAGRKCRQNFSSHRLQTRLQHVWHFAMALSA